MTKARWKVGHDSDFGLTLGVLGKTPSYLAVKVSFSVALENITKYLYCLCFNMVSFRGQKKLGLRPDRSLLGFNSKFPASIRTPFISGVPPPPGSKSV